MHRQKKIIFLQLNLVDLLTKKFLKIFLSCIWILIITTSIFLLYYAISSYIEKLENNKRKVDANQILTGKKLTQCINTACGKTTCTTEKNWQNAYYKMFGKKTACAVALYKIKPEYLKNKVPYPRHHRCYHRFDTKFFEQEGINYKNLKEKYLKTTDPPKTISSNKFKIPRKLNFVWLTSEKEFKTKKKNFFKINEYIFHNTTITPNWGHIIWTNNIDWITKKAKEKLREHKIILKSIDEINMSNPKHKALWDLTKKYTTQNRWGLASDIARALVLYYEGGIYVDGDYEIKKPQELEKYMKSYRSFFGINNFNYRSKDLFEVINAFLASKAKGKIIEKNLDLIYRNTIDIMNAPDYIKYPCNKFQETLFKTGPMSLTIAFDLEKNNSDALLPYCTLFDMPGSFLECFNKTQLGKHHFHGSWAKKLRRKNFIY